MGISVLIVDDEVIERQALKKMISAELKQIEIIGDAENGRQAIDKARSLKPDIIMMDIKMPGVDGVEAVKQIRPELPKTKFIMVSAYNTFEYAKQVMREGVKEYLLKPSKKSEIIDTIQRVILEIEEERELETEHQELNESYNRALSFIQSEWVSALILDHIQDFENEEWEALFNPKENDVSAFVCELYIKEGKIENKKQVYSWVKMWFKERERGYVGPMSGEQIPIFVLREKGIDITPQSDAIQLAKLFMRDLEKQVSDVKVKIGMGTPVNSANNFAESYHEALLALDQTNSNVRYAYYNSDYRNLVEGKALDFKIENELIMAVKNGDIDNIARIFKLYFKELEETYKGNLEKMSESLWEMWIVLSRMLKDMGVSVSMTKPQARTIPQLKETIKARLLSIGEDIIKWKQDNMEGVLYQAKTYIEEHFNEAISLEDVANQVQLSPYYFTKLFKDNFGMTYIEYLTKYRIEHAIVLMNTTDLTQKEICYEIGYRDPNYFSRVFKKWTKLSPSEYRNSIKQA